MVRTAVIPVSWINKGVNFKSKTNYMPLSDYSVEALDNLYDIVDAYFN